MNTLIVSTFDCSFDDFDKFVAEFCFFKYQLNKKEENLFEGIEVTNIKDLVMRFRFKYIYNLIEYPKTIRE